MAIATADDRDKRELRFLLAQRHARFHTVAGVDDRRCSVFCRRPPAAHAALAIVTYGESSSKHESSYKPASALLNREKGPFVGRTCGMGLPRPLCAVRDSAAREALPPAAPGSRTPKWWVGTRMTEDEAERGKGTTSQAPAAQPCELQSQLRRRRAPVLFRVGMCVGGADPAREIGDAQALQGQDNGHPRVLHGCALAQAAIEGMHIAGRSCSQLLAPCTARAVPTAAALAVGCMTGGIPA
mmetsp:Transcript_20632/g.66820  ORF Transcript_20632/g.66820 Transcript_20632/m.66820 type:complete len:241 (+) Transcript_20632:151-873(+)